MNKESVDCRRIRHVPIDPNHKLEPGDFAWSTDFPYTTDADRADPRRQLYICLPGEKSWDSIPVIRGNPNPAFERTWGWDGNEDKPTLAPSIHYQGHWHGYLAAGRLISCP